MRISDAIPGWRGAVGVVALCLAVSLVAPPATSSAKDPAKAGGAGGASSAAAGSCRGSMKLTVSGKRFGKKASVRVRRIPGSAKASPLALKIGRSKTLRDLAIGRYRIKAKAIRGKGRTSTATVRPERPRVSADTTTNVAIEYSAADPQSDAPTADSRIGEITVGGPSTSIAVSRDGTAAYISLNSDFRVVVVDLAPDMPSVLTRFEATSPRGLAVSPDGATLYFAALDPVSGKGVLQRRNTTDGAATGRPIPVGAQPQGVAISPDGRRVYVANSADRTVSVVDTAAGTVTSTVQVDSNPTELAMSPDGSRLYVAAADLNVIDTTSTQVVANVPIDSEANGVAVSSTGRDIYVSSSNRLTFVDAATNQVRFLVGSLGTLANSVALSPDDARAYVSVGGTGASEGSVKVVDLISRRLDDTIPGSPGASEIGFRDDGRYALVTQQRGTSVAIVQMADRATRPSGVAIVGTPAVGQVLQAVPEVIASSPFPPAVTYQWQSGAGGTDPFTDIPGARSTSYTVTPADTGRYLRVVLTAENQEGKQSIASEPVAVPAAARPSTPGSTPSTPGSSTPSTPTGQPSNPVGSTVGPAPKVTVGVKSVKRKGKLSVQVSPSLGATTHWTFRVQKRVKRKWRTLKRNYTTRGTAQTKVIDLPRGKYRVVVAGANGYGGTTSPAVKLRR